MRIAYLLIPASFVLSCGCASMIARSGFDPTELKNKDNVHAKFGQPCSAGEEKGDCYEEYFTRQKLALYPIRYGAGYGIGLVITLGTIDLLYVPVELCSTTKRTIAGQTLRFTYDGLGNVIKVELDGKEDDFFGFNHFHRDAQKGEPVSAKPANDYVPSIPPVP